MKKQKTKAKSPKPKQEEVLIPPDLKQCQCEVNEGSFMSFGTPRTRRCTAKPIVIVTETELRPGSTKLGAMTLCAEHLRVFLNDKPAGCTIKKIEPDPGLESHVVTKDGKTVFGPGTHDQCWLHIHKGSYGASVAWLMKYEGYAIVRIKPEE